MRVTCFVCCMLSAAFGFASEPGDVVGRHYAWSDLAPRNALRTAARTHLIADAPTAAAHESCRLAQDAPLGDEAVVELDVRVISVNVTRLRKLGFDFASFSSSFGSDQPQPVELLLRERRQTLAEFMAAGTLSGLTGLLDALDQEGLVEQDVVLTQAIADGKAWESTTRWRSRPAEGQAIWHSVRLRIRPTLLGKDAVQLETACGAATSRGRPCEPQLAEYGVELGESTVGLSADFVPVDLQERPRDSLRAIVLLTAKGRRGGEQPAGNDELFAPRNVLGQAAPTASEPDDALAQDYEPQLFAEDALLNGGREVAAEDVYVTPLTYGEPLPGAKPEVEALFLIDPPRKPQRRSRPEVLIFGGVKPRIMEEGKDR